MPEKNRWNRIYKLAEAYYMENGNLLIPDRYMVGDIRLGRWIGTQRSDYVKRTNPFFDQRRIELLEAIGMVWNEKAAVWQEMYGYLAEYGNRNGNVRVPQNYVTSEKKNLGTWVNKQRMCRRQGILSAERTKMLEELGIIWDPEILRRSSWEDFYQELIEYKQSHGEKMPPAGYVTAAGTKLGIWFSNQKSEYKAGTLLPDRRKKLDEIGICLDVNEKQWLKMYDKAESYYKTYGNLCLFLQRKKNENENTESFCKGKVEGLGNWLGRQRKCYRNGILSEKHFRKLQKIGMIWDVREEQWERMFCLAAGYYEKNGDLKVPEKEHPLCDWVSTQRKNYKDRKNPYFTEERIRRLENIGIVWDASPDLEEIWENWYQKAEKIFGKQGNLNTEDRGLKTWIQAQKYAKKGGRGSLTHKQQQRLEDIGIVWNCRETRWDEMFQYARKYYEIHELLNVPVNYVTADGKRLGIWIAGQRRAYRNYQLKRRGKGERQLDRKKICRLNEIGMVWDAAERCGKTSFPEKIIFYYLKKSGRQVRKIFPWDQLEYVDINGKTKKIEPVGREFDVFLPEEGIAIEYDGVLWHKDKWAEDTEKNRICEKLGIRLIRIREPGLMEMLDCAMSIRLKSVDYSELERAVCEVFHFLNYDALECDISRDQSQIMEEYKNYTSQKWDRVYEELVEKNHMGKTWTSSKGEYYNWIADQREAYKNDELTELQTKKLKKLGISLDPFGESWENKYRLAKAYYDQHEDLMIPIEFQCPDDGKGGRTVQLGKWLASQRGLYRKGLLSQQRIHRMEQLEIEWNPQKNRKKSNFAALEKYYQKNGTINIPRTELVGDRTEELLSRLISEKRKQYRLGRLEQEEIDFLENLGICWNVPEKRWENWYQEAENYYKKHGNLWVPPDYVTEKEIHLGGWISRQRRKKKEEKLSQEEERRLDAIGMIWDPYTVRWMKNYKIAEEYYRKHGNLRVPAEYITEEGIKLGMWIGTQRQAGRGNPNYHMTKERRELLDRIGMYWDI